jgi:hypothetical protein
MKKNIRFFLTFIFRQRAVVKQDRHMKHLLSYAAMMQPLQNPPICSRIIDLHRARAYMTSSARVVNAQ